MQRGLKSTIDRKSSTHTGRVTKPKSRCSCNAAHKPGHASAKLCDPLPVGLKIEVYWPFDKMYYPGVIDTYDKRKNTYRVVYNDGDVEILNMSKEKWRLLGGCKDAPDTEEAPDHSSTLTETSSTPDEQKRLDKSSDVDVERETGLTLNVTMQKATEDKTSPSSGREKEPNRSDMDRSTDRTSDIWSSARTSQPINLNVVDREMYEAALILIQMSRSG